MNAKINEIFFSYQGEGIYQGVQQIFIRFSDCNLNCKYCDTNYSCTKEVSVNDLIKELVVDDSLLHRAHSISITGGEPLCQVEFLKEFLPKLRDYGCRIYLETNGVLFEKLEIVVPYIDIVAMDIKLPSSTGCSGFWEEHKKFLEIALVKEVFTKTVITEETTEEDFKKAVDIIKEVSKDTILILQPVTPVDNCKKPSLDKVSYFMNIALESISNIRVIPQLHPIWGIK